MGSFYLAKMVLIFNTQPLQRVSFRRVRFSNCIQPSESGTVGLESRLFTSTIGLDLPHNHR